MYEAEVPAAGMLHAALVEAPISCGDVLSVDATPAVRPAGLRRGGLLCGYDVLQPSPQQPSSASPTFILQGGLPRSSPQAPCKRQEKRHARSALPGAAGGNGAGPGARHVLPAAMVGRFPAEPVAVTRPGRSPMPISSSDIDTRPPSTIIIPWNRTP